jgi:ABC-type Fe3+ transport system permease subunit
MSRELVAYLIIILTIVCCLAVVIQLFRFARYERAIQRGKRPAKPVRKPFWLP